MMAMTATSARPAIEFGGTIGVIAFGIGRAPGGRRLDRFGRLRTG